MDNTALYTDEALLERMKTGDQQAFTQLYNKYSGQIYINILSMVKDDQLAAELVQEIFCRIWQKKQSIQVQQSFSAYLFQCSKNLVHDFYRKLQHNSDLYNRFKAAATENYQHVEESLELKENNECLQRALNTLSPQQKKVYRLCRMEGYSYKEVASQLNISPLTVKEYLVKANHLIRAYMLKNMDGVFTVMLLLSIQKSSQ